MMTRIGLTTMGILLLKNMSLTHWMLPPTSNEAWKDFRMKKKVALQRLRQAAGLDLMSFGCQTRFEETQSMINTLITDHFYKIHD
jgi:hypothetical protein